MISRLIFTLSFVLIVGVQGVNAQDMCKDSQIRKNVSKALREIKGTPQEDEIVQQIQHSMPGKTIKSAEMDDMKEAMMEYALRTAGGCEISKRLKEKVSATLNMGTEGNKQCKMENYDEKVLGAYQELSASPSYPSMLVLFKAEVLKNITVPSMRQQIEDKLDKDPVLQEKMVKAALQSSIMAEDNCANASLPMFDLLSDFQQ